MAVQLQDVIDILRLHQDRLQAMGIVHASVFGSTARGLENDRSDVDIVIDLRSTPSIFEYAAIKESVGGLFDQRADVIMRQAMRPAVLERVEKEQVSVF